MNISSEKVEIYVNGKPLTWTKFSEKFPQRMVPLYVALKLGNGFTVEEGWARGNSVYTDNGCDDLEEITDIAVAWMPLLYPTYSESCMLSEVVTEAKLDDLQQQADEKAKQFMCDNFETTKNEVVDIYRQIQETLKEEK